MHAVFAGLTTLDVVHLLDHAPDPLTKTTSLAHLFAAGGPATNAAVTAAALSRILLADEGGPTRAGGATGDGPQSPVQGVFSLLTAVGTGPVADLLAADLRGAGVDLLDATDRGEGSAQAFVPAGSHSATGPAATGPATHGPAATGPGAGSPTAARAAVTDTGPATADPTTPGLQDPAISSVVEHPGGRGVVSTNARLPIDDAQASRLLSAATRRSGAPDVVLVDGHNPSLAQLALRLGTASEGSVPQRPGPSGSGGDGHTGPPSSAPGVQGDPFAELEDHPSHLRVLDGGSWKPWFTPLLGLVDVAVVSADFRTPLSDDPDAIADFLAGFGITKVVRTDGAGPVRWWWDGARGSVEVPPTSAVSTTGAGDVFHGAFAWGLGRLHEAGGPEPSSVAGPADPTRLIAFASAVASLSTRTFGTRAWRGDPELGALVAGW